MKTVCALIFPQHLSHKKDLLVFSVESRDSLWTSFSPAFRPKPILARLPPFCWTRRFDVKEKVSLLETWKGCRNLRPYDLRLFSNSPCAMLFLPFRWTVCVKRFQMILSVKWLCDKSGDLILWYLIITQNITLRYILYPLEFQMWWIDAPEFTNIKEKPTWDCLENHIFRLCWKMHSLFFTGRPLRGPGLPARLIIFDKSFKWN